MLSCPRTIPCQFLAVISIILTGTAIIMRETLDNMSKTIQGDFSKYLQIGGWRIIQPNHDLISALIIKIVQQFN